MDTEQQKEALAHFSKNAGQWKEKSVADQKDVVNVVRQRNNYVLRFVEPGMKRVLDVGCGTGDLVYAIAEKGVPALGVDFAPEMIDIANKECPPELKDLVAFTAASIFDVPLEEGSFDLISANGFIEYISYDELDRFWQLCRKALRPGGHLIFGSRNRLFNLVTFNSYTDGELRSGQLPALVKETILTTACTDPKQLKDIETIPLQPKDFEHAYTGIEVSSRFQFTPAQIAQMMDRNHFDVADIGAIHIHGITPAFGKDHVELHAEFSNLLHHYSDDLRLLSAASSFMTHAVRRD